MPFCSKCGTEVAEGINFCGKCGNALGSGQSTNPNPATTQTNYTAPGGGVGMQFVLEKDMLFRIIGKLGYIFVIIGFCMPITRTTSNWYYGVSINGFQAQDVGIGILFCLLLILMFISAVVGVIIGILYLTRININTDIDWITTNVCIVSGLIVYFQCLEGEGTLLSGAYLILIGWIIALGCQIISDGRGICRKISTGLRNPRNRRKLIAMVVIFAGMLLLIFIGKDSDKRFQDKIRKIEAVGFPQ